MSEGKITVQGEEDHHEDEINDVQNGEEEENSYNEEEEVLVLEYNPEVGNEPEPPTERKRPTCFVWLARAVMILVVLNILIQFIKPAEGNAIQDPETMVQKTIVDIQTQLYKRISDRNNYYYVKTLESIGKLLNTSQYKDILIRQMYQTNLINNLQTDLLNYADFCDIDYHQYIIVTILQIFNDVIMNGNPITFQQKFVRNLIESCADHDVVIDAFYITARALNHVGFYNSNSQIITSISKVYQKMGNGPWLNLPLDYIAKVTANSKPSKQAEKDLCEFVHSLKTEELSYNSKLNFCDILNRISCADTKYEIPDFCEVYKKIDA